jgi:hypothetical protein
MKITGTISFSLVLEKEPQYVVRFIISDNGFVVSGENHMAYTLVDQYQIQVKIAYFDENQNPAVVDGATTWTTADAAISNVVVDANDSTLATISGLSIGQTQITTSADADLGAGVVNILGTLDVNVVAGQAVSATISPVGEAVPIPPGR